MRLLRPLGQRTYERVFGVVYVGLMANVLLTVGCAPLLLALAVVADPAASWPFFVVLSGCCAPAVAGVFGVFADGSVQVWRPYWAAYRRAFLPSLAAWYGAAVVVVVLVVDARALPALLPLFASTAVLAVTCAIAVILVAATHPTLPGGLARSCLYLTARRWYLALFNAVVLATAAAIVLMRPVEGLLVACAPLLYVVFANTRAVVSPLGTPGIVGGR
ncbi:MULTISPECIES: hypothetical protein [unclassified Saccharothrix]|uniref:hypothetical protein n=1 Tax=unclassified Saccharothrix TaxID=2593673 RepID=UPI00307D7D8D